MRWLIFGSILCVCAWSIPMGCSPAPNTEQTAEGTTELPGESTTDTTGGDASTEPAPDKSPDTVVNTEPATEPTTDKTPGTEPTTEPTVEVSPDAGTEPATEPVVETQPDAGTEPAPDITTQEPSVETVPEQVVETQPEPTPEPVAEAAPEGGGSQAVPTNGTDLLKYLQAGNYKSWAKESKIHSGGIHGSVLVYINSTLDASLKAGNTTHPVGAASVKELYSGNQINGYAVMVKVSQGSGGGTWYWYERIGTSVVADGNGVGGCTGCHSSGKDYFRTQYPLQ